MLIEVHYIISLSLSLSICVGVCGWVCVCGCGWVVCVMWVGVGRWVLECVYARGIVKKCQLLCHDRKALKENVENGRRQRMHFSGF